MDYLQVVLLCSYPFQTDPLGSPNIPFVFIAILIYTSYGWGCHWQEGTLPTNWAQFLYGAIILPADFRGRYINPMGPEAYLHNVGGGRTELINLNQL